MIDLTRRQLLLGSLISTGMIAAPGLAQASDRYQILMTLQRDVLDTMAVASTEGRQFYERVGYAEKRAAYTAFLRDRWHSTLTQKEISRLSKDVHEAEAVMRQTTVAAWKAINGDAKVDTLLRFLLREFNRSDLTDPRVRQTVQDLMHGRLKIDVLDEQQLRTVEDAVVSIAIAKHLLSVARCPIETGKMASFNEFATTYRELIL